MQNATRYWFPAKRYGWGWGFPITWEGWLTLAVFSGWLPLVVSYSPRKRNWLLIFFISRLSLHYSLP